MPQMFSLENFYKYIRIRKHILNTKSNKYKCTNTKTFEKMLSFFNTNSFLQRGAGSCRFQGIYINEYLSFFASVHIISLGIILHFCLHTHAHI